MKRRVRSKKFSPDCYQNHLERSIKTSADPRLEIQFPELGIEIYQDASNVRISVYQLNDVLGSILDT